MLYPLNAPNVVKAGLEGLEARVALAGLLVRHAADKLPSPDKMSRSLTLALAEYYSSEKDERAVGLYEELLAERKGPGGPQPVEVDELWDRADYYEKIGQKDKEAATLARAPEYSTLPYMLGDSAMRAARLYRAIGDADKAQVQYTSS